MRIGIIGAENSHTSAIAKTINVDKAIPGFTVDCVWGETPDFAKAAAEAGQIPTIVDHEHDMLGRIDAVIVDHRHAKFHLPAVLPYVKAGIPAFVDKPFCFRAAEGREFIAAAKAAGTPITSFSVLPHQQSFRDLQAKLATLGPLKAFTSYGPCDVESPHGGIFFYGIHQVEMVLKAVGYDVTHVLVTRHGDNGTAQMMYANGMIATLNLIKVGSPGFVCHAVGEQGEHGQKMPMDENPYLHGIQTFCHMFKTGEEPETYEHMLRPVQVLEALKKSVASGKLEAVEA